MKKVFPLLMMPVLLAASACSSDEPDVKNLAAEAAGTYDGYTEASCRYFSGDFSDGQKVTVAAGSDADKVSISYTSPTWGQVSVAEATVSESAAGYMIAGEGKWTMGMDGNLSDYDCSASGVVKGTEAEFIFTCPSVMGGLTITFRTGTMPPQSNDE